MTKVFLALAIACVASGVLGLLIAFGYSIKLGVFIRKKSKALELSEPSTSENESIFNRLCMHQSTRYMEVMMNEPEVKRLFIKTFGIAFLSMFIQLFSLIFFILASDKIGAP